MDHLIQHFRKEEQPFIEQAVDWKNEVENRYAPKLTDFLDPRQRFIVASVIGHNGDIKIQGSGVFSNAERERLLIFPSYFEPNEADYQITVFTIKYPAKFVQLKHPDVLGALLSLGLERSKFGDIRVNDYQVQFAVEKEIEDFVRMQLSGIGKVKVHVEAMQVDEPLITIAEEWKEEMHTVSSMRLDVIMAKILNISRQKSQALISGKKVKVNWTERESVSFEIQEGDILSVRGFGRIKVIMIEGRTKKDKIRIQIGLLEKK